MLGSLPTGADIWTKQDTFTKTRHPTMSLPMSSRQESTFSINSLRFVLNRSGLQIWSRLLRKIWLIGPMTRATDSSKPNKFQWETKSFLQPSTLKDTSTTFNREISEVSASRVDIQLVPWMRRLEKPIIRNLIIRISSYMDQQDSSQLTILILFIANTWCQIWTTRCSVFPA
jgi:hypothetical protein